MKELARIKLREAQIFCDVNDKSTAFMIQYMQDYAGVDFDCVMKYLENNHDNRFKQRPKH